MNTREIVTLQFGHFSNFVGAHFWNIQELSFDYTGTVTTEVNHDILYREGKTVDNKVTYTPRLLISDLKGSLRTFPAAGGLSDDSEDVENIPWGAVERIEQPSIKKNKYLANIDSEQTLVPPNEYNLDDEVQSWTDYLYPRFHTRTVNIVNEYSHGNENECFDIFNAGSSLWKGDYGDTFGDKIRQYVEECDSIQGFHVNFDATDGFTGLASSCIQDLADEYGKTILSYPIIASYFKDNDCRTQEERDKATIKDSIRLVNLALTVESVSQHVSLFSPLCTSQKGWRKPGEARLFEYVNYNPQLYYHSSAILASALDTLSQKYRHKDNIFTLSDICADMSGYGRKMAATSLGLPVGIERSKYLIEHLNDSNRPLYQTITPSCKLATDKIFQCITVRGIPENYLKAPPNEAKEQKNLPAYQCRNIKEMFELYFQANNFLSATNVTICQKPLETKTPYPNFFSKKLDTHGFVLSDESTERPESVPVIAGYHNGTFLADMLEKLHREVSRIKFAKLHRFKEEGLEEEDFKERMNSLAEFRDNYMDDFEL